MITLINTEILREKRLNQQRGHGVKSVRKFLSSPTNPRIINRSLKRIRPQNVPKQDVVILLQKIVKRPARSHKFRRLSTLSINLFQKQYTEV